MSIADLLSLIPPPESPRETGGDDWKGVEREFGTSLPSDYKDYIKTYGSGVIDGGSIVPLNPFSRNQSANLIVAGRKQLAAVKYFKDRYGDKACPYPLFPDQGGLLPWGLTGMGNTMYWLTRGQPDKWTTVVGSLPGEMEYYHYRRTMTGFLVAIASRRLRCPLVSLSPDRILQFRYLSSG